MLALFRPGAPLCPCSFTEGPVNFQKENAGVAGGILKLAGARFQGQFPPPRGQRKVGKLVKDDAAMAARRSLCLQAQSKDGGLSSLGKQDQSAPGILDGVFLALFRRAMSREVGWDSPKPGYDGLVEVANRLMAKHASRSDTEEATVRILRSMFPPALLPLFRLLVAPLSGGRPAALLTARVTQATCQWLMGPCKVNDVEFPDGSKMSSGVLVEKCKYLEESKCAGICIHTCKMPTQAFIKNDMGIPLVMEPNFEDYSCQFKFGVNPPPREDDEALRASCLSTCPSAMMAASRPRVSAKLAPEGGPRICPQVVV